MMRLEEVDILGRNGYKPAASSLSGSFNQKFAVYSSCFHFLLFPCVSVLRGSFIPLRLYIGALSPVSPHWGLHSFSSSLKYLELFRLSPTSLLQLA